MDKNGPIVLIDDDDDDLHLFIEIFADMNLENEVHMFKNPASLIAFLQRPDIHPFLIISDVSMPAINGFMLRDKLRNDPLINPKNIPYLFFSTATTLKVAESGLVNEFQGIFKKPDKKSEWKAVLDSIVNYWKLSLPPEQYSSA